MFESAEWVAVRDEIWQIVRSPNVLLLLLLKSVSVCCYEEPDNSDVKQSVKDLLTVDNQRIEQSQNTTVNQLEPFLSSDTNDIQSSSVDNSIAIIPSSLGESVTYYFSHRCDVEVTIKC